MRFSFRSSFCLSLLLAGVCHAQLTIPNDVVTATQPLNASQQEQMVQAIESWTGQLRSGEDDAISTARENMIRQFGRVQPDSGGVFLAAYSRALARRLVPLVSSDRPMLVQMNALIVLERSAAFFADPTLIEAVGRGLNSDTAAVRYWAAKTARVLVDQSFGAQQQVQLLNIVKAALGRESTPAVYQQLIVALSNMRTVPGAMEAVLDELNNRVNRYAKDPTLPLSAVLGSLKQLFQTTVSDVAAEREVRLQTLRSLTIVAYRFLYMATQQLDRGAAPERSVDEFKDMVTTADAILRWTVEQIGVAPNRHPQPLANAVANDDWALVNVVVAEWQRLLTAGPLNFTDAEIGVQFE